MVQMRMEGFKKVQQAEDLERVIEKDDSNSSVATDYEEGPPDSCRGRLVHVLNTNKFQIAVISLVVIDGLLIIAELLINLSVLEMNDASSIPRVLHYISLVILSIFLVEVVVKVASMQRKFVRSKMEVFDALVVGVTFTLAIAFTANEGIRTSVGLVILLRLWRVTKVLNNMVLSVKLRSERRLQHERNTREAVEQELAKFREYCTAQEHEIAVLQAVLRKHGITFDEAEQPAAASTISIIAEVNDINEEQSLICQEQRHDNASDTSS